MKKLDNQNMIQLSVDRKPTRRPTDYSFQRMHTALHEAGHAVVGWKLGWLPTSVTILPPVPQVVYERVEFDYLKEWQIPDSERQLYLIRMLMRNAAGVAAEKQRFSQCSWVVLWMTSGKNDYERMKENIEEFYPGDRLIMGLLVEEVQKRARYFVREHWDDIKRLASVLLKKNVLYGAKIIDATSEPMSDEDQSLWEVGQPQAIQRLGVGRRM